MPVARLYSKELREVILAYRLAKYGHRGQTRLDQTRYFDHTKSVALIIMLEFYVYHRSAIICGLLHDIKEEGPMLSWRHIIKIFGKDVCRGLKILTKEDIKDYFHPRKKLPAKYLTQGIPAYIRRELSYACNRIRKSLDLPTKKH